MTKLAHEDAMDVFASGKDNTFNGKPIPSIDKGDLPEVGIEARIKLSQLYAQVIQEQSKNKGADPSDPDFQVNVSDESGSDSAEFDLPLYFDSISDTVINDGGVQRLVKGTFVPRKHSITGLPVLRGNSFVYKRSE